MNNINYTDFPKGTQVKMVWGCHDLYTGIIVKNLKYKLVIQTLTKDNKLHIELRDFSKEYVRRIDYLL
jgi:hypothetical protein